MWTILKTVLGFIPAVFEYLNKKQDIDLEKYKVDGTVDVSIIQAQAQLQAVLKDDPVLRWGRRFFIYPVGVWWTLVVYDSCFRELLPDWMTWRVLALPPNLEYIVYAITGFLFLHAWRK
jgi:hypothetical protein